MSRHRHINTFFIVLLGSRPRDDRFSRDANGRNQVLCFSIQISTVFLSFSFSFLFILFFSSCRFTFTVSCYCLCLSFCLSLHSSTCPFYFSPSCLRSAICSRNARDGSLHGSRRRDFHTVAVSVFGAIF